MPRDELIVRGLVGRMLSQIVNGLDDGRSRQFRVTADDGKIVVAELRFHLRHACRDMTETRTDFLYGPGLDMNEHHATILAGPVSPNKGRLFKTIQN